MGRDAVQRPVRPHLPAARSHRLRLEALQYLILHDADDARHHVPRLQSSGSHLEFGSGRPVTGIAGCSDGGAGRTSGGRPSRAALLRVDRGGGGGSEKRARPPGVVGIGSR